MYNGIDLSGIAGLKPSIYGLNLATKLFDEEELRRYCLSPKKAHRHGRSPFPPDFAERISAMKCD